MSACQACHRSVNVSSYCNGGRVCRRRSRKGAGEIRPSLTTLRSRSHHQSGPSASPLRLLSRPVIFCLMAVAACTSPKRAHSSGSCSKLSQTLEISTLDLYMCPQTTCRKASIKIEEGANGRYLEQHDAIELRTHVATLVATRQISNHVQLIVSSVTKGELLLLDDTPYVTLQAYCDQKISEAASNSANRSRLYGILFDNEIYGRGEHIRVSPRNYLTPETISQQGDLGRPGQWRSVDPPVSGCGWLRVDATLTGSTH